FMSESTIADVLAASLEQRTLHSARSLIAQNTLKTHNEPLRHWAGDHGSPAHLTAPDIEAALALHARSQASGAYVDRHAWQFTDASFERIIQLLNDLGSLSLRPHRIYPALANTNEFWAILGPKPAEAPARAHDLPAVSTALPPRDWHLDSVQVQPNLLIVRGWSPQPVTGAELQAPGINRILGQVQSAHRRETWATLDEAQRQRGFIAVFPLRDDLPLEQYREASVHLTRPDGAIHDRLLHIGMERLPQQHAVHGLYRTWLDSLDETSRVIEIGSRARLGVTLRDNLRGDYLGIDIVEGPNVDLVADAHLLTDRVSRTDFTHAISASVFEHLYCPIQAASELNAVLADGALVYMHSHQSWGYHEEPWDFFRFSDSAWRAIFNEKTGFEVIAAGMTDDQILVPVSELGNPSLIRQGDHGRAFATSLVLARKIGPSRVPRIYTAGDLARLYPGVYPL
ncbi:MAG: hypothetical protein ACR2J8_03335, partial [Thermomicrobiales bacterium]